VFRISDNFSQTFPVIVD